MVEPGDPKPMLFANQAELFQWLETRAQDSGGVWLMIAKKGSAATSIRYNDAVETALRFGWVDSQVRRYDERYYLQRFSPRRPTSTWTRANVDKAKQLLASGRMQPSGLAAIEAAKQNGRWPS